MHLESVKGTWIDVQFGRDAGLQETHRVLDVFVAKHIPEPKGGLLFVIGRPPLKSLASSYFTPISAVVLNCLEAGPCLIYARVKPSCFMPGMICSSKISW